MAGENLNGIAELGHKTKRVVCKGCGIPFTIPVRSGGAKKYCSMKCSKRHAYYKDKPKIIRTEKTCPVCGKAFLSPPTNRTKIYCSRKCLHAFSAHKFYLKNKDTVYQTYRGNALKRRLAVIEYLGGKCAKCGLEDWRVLQINHINGGGNRDVKSKRGRNYALQQEIVTGKREGEFNLLCANCNILYEYERDIRWKGVICPTKP